MYPDNSHLVTFHSVHLQKRNQLDYNKDNYKTDWFVVTRHQTYN